MTNDTEHLFMSLLAIGVLSLRNVSSNHLLFKKKIELFVFLLICKSFLYIMKTSPLLDIY